MSQTMMLLASQSIPVKSLDSIDWTAPGSSNLKPSTPSTPSGHSTISYRLLYRGALSLPDSHLLLDGLTFVAQLDSPTKNASVLLQNPLALALESMRGRPSLRFKEIVKLSDIENGCDGLWVDDSGGVEMEVHPGAILSRIFFENNFCLLPFSSRSDIGIKIALGDTDGPDTTEAVIFAQAPPLVTPVGSTPPPTVKLTVARLTHRTLARLPRPDDPIPRKPPLIFNRGLKRVNSASMVTTNEALREVPLAKKQRIAAELGSGARVRLAQEDGVFKVPDIPDPKGKGKAKARDTFGDGAVAVDGWKRETHTDEGILTVEKRAEMEKMNKNKIKKAAADYLWKTKDPTGRYVDKTHPEFKEVYGFVYRGVIFAMRATMRAQPVDAVLISRLIGAHVRMYVSCRDMVVNGQGDS